MRQAARGDTIQLRGEPKPRLRRCRNRAFSRLHRGPAVAMPLVRLRFAQSTKMRRRHMKWIIRYGILCGLVFSTANCSDDSEPIDVVHEKATQTSDPMCPVALVLSGKCNDP